MYDLIQKQINEASFQEDFPNGNKQLIAWYFANILFREYDEIKNLIITDDEHVDAFLEDDIRHESIILSGIFTPTSFIEDKSLSEVLSSWKRIIELSMLHTNANLSNDVAESPQSKVSKSVSEIIVPNIASFDDTSLDWTQFLLITTSYLAPSAELLLEEFSTYIESITPIKSTTTILQKDFYISVIDVDELRRLHGVAKQTNFYEGFCALENWLPLAENGDAGAQYLLTMEYDEGYLGNQISAFYWYEKAAEQGDKDAQYKLGEKYSEGWGVTQDYEKAFEWFKKAAEQGHEKAQYELGEKYLDGCGVTQNYKMAFDWFEKAGEQGHEEAKFMLGHMYYHGKGVKNDFKQSFNLHEELANNGHVIAQYNLGNYYTNGEGVAQNYNQAFYWYEKAAERGHEKSQYNLGLLLYARELRGANDIVQAHKWSNLAAINGLKEAVERRNFLEKHMTQVQIAEAQKLASEWKKSWI